MLDMFLAEALNLKLDTGSVSRDSESWMVAGMVAEMAVGWAGLGQKVAGHRGTAADSVGLRVNILRVSNRYSKAVLAPQNVADMIEVEYL